MATRKESGDRREALQEELRLACRNGTLPSGIALPPVRELAARHNVSHRIVHEALRALKQDGLLYSVPRLGTFVGAPLQVTDGLYITLSPDPAEDGQLARLLLGFEEGISRLGGNCLRVSPEVLRRTVTMEAPIQLSGVFHWNVTPEELEQLVPTDCSRVAADFDRAGPYDPKLDGVAGQPDRVHFDNVGGGYQMARYLQQQGHRNIAFLGMHNVADPDAAFTWSRERCVGWERALAEGSTASEHLLYTPAVMGPDRLDIRRQRSLCAHAARPLSGALAAQKITAVITVNVHAAHGLFHALSEAGIPPSEWPVVTTFGIGDAKVAMMTSMVLPWEQLGREAAELLWSRSRGTYQGPGRAIAVPMRLVARLTCRPSWRTSPEGALFNTQPFLTV